MNRSPLAIPTSNPIAKALLCGTLAAAMVFAQEPIPGDSTPQAPAGNTGSQSAGWPRASDPSPAGNTAPQSPDVNARDTNNGYPANANDQNPPPYQQNGPYNQNAPYGQSGAYQSPPAAPSQPVPSQLTIKPGTFVTVRVNQTLSSDRSQPGEAFSATLVRPVVVDGVVVAQPGQTLGGRVVEAQKAGRIEGTSRLRVQLTDLTLADGQQLSIQSQFINWSGGTSVGRDAGAVAGTTALGAAVGAAAGWGTGAAIGAGAGAAAGVIGVLLTRGRPTVIYPESVLTFRIEAPVSFSTDRAPQAFHYIEPGEYDQPAAQAQRPPAYAAAPYAAAPPPAPAPYFYGYYGPSYYYGYPYWGSSFFFYGGPRAYYGPRFYPYRGYYRR